MVTKACYLSEFITKLQEIIAEHGDMQVWVSDSFQNPLCLDDIFVADNRLIERTRQVTDTNTDKILYI